MDTLITQLKDCQDPESKFSFLSQFFSKKYTINPEDTSILLIVNGALLFRYPTALKSCALPIDKNSIAGRTYIDNKVLVFNRFAEIKHVRLFENFVKDEARKSNPVQRIISVPIPGKDGPKGVIQICRKGSSKSDAEEFSREDAEFAVNTVSKIAEYL